MTGGKKQEFFLNFERSSLSEKEGLECVYYFSNINRFIAVR